MGFMVNPQCKCCCDMLWHCKRCWDKYHNGKKHLDYIPPKYYGQSIGNEKFFKKIKQEFGIEHNPTIKPNKNKPYKEGEYH